MFRRLWNKITGKSSVSQVSLTNEEITGIYQVTALAGNALMKEREKVSCQNETIERLTAQKRNLLVRSGNQRELAEFIFALDSKQALNPKGVKALQMLCMPLHQVPLAATTTPQVVEAADTIADHEKAVSLEFELTALRRKIAEEEQDVIERLAAASAGAED